MWRSWSETKSENIPVGSSLPIRFLIVEISLQVHRYIFGSSFAGFIKEDVENMGMPEISCALKHANLGMIGYHKVNCM